MTTGVVDRLNERGFGFIKPDDGSENIFFHSSGMARDGVRFDDLREGDKVEYEPGFDDKNGKNKAFNVLCI